MHLVWTLESVEGFPALSDIKCDAIWDQFKVEAQMGHQFIYPGQFVLKCLIFLRQMQFLDDFLQNVERHGELKEMLWHC